MAISNQEVKKETPSYTYRFTCIISFNLHNTPGGYCSLCILKKVNKAKRICNLPKVNKALFLHTVTHNAKLYTFF